jgi:hypothetical protein
MTAIPKMYVRHRFRRRIAHLLTTPVGALHPHQDGVPAF